MSVFTNSTFGIRKQNFSITPCNGDEDAVEHHLQERQKNQFRLVLEAPVQNFVKNLITL